MDTGYHSFGFWLGLYIIWREINLEFTLILHTRAPSVTIRSISTVWGLKMTCSQPWYFNSIGTLNIVLKGIIEAWSFGEMEWRVVSCKACKTTQTNLKLVASIFHFQNPCPQMINSHLKVSTKTSLNQQTLWHCAYQTVLILTPNNPKSNRPIFAKHQSWNN